MYITCYHQGVRVGLNREESDCGVERQNTWQICIMRQREPMKQKSGLSPMNFILTAPNCLVYYLSATTFIHQTHLTEKLETQWLGSFTQLVDFYGYCEEGVVCQREDRG